MAPKLVLFDCDGVLVNSEEAAWETQRDYIASHGLHYSDDDRAELLSGQTYEGFIKKIAEDYRAKFGKDLPPGFGEGLRAAYQKSDWAGKLRALDGVKDLLQTLKASGVPFCVVSNSGQASLVKKLQIVKLHDYFHPHIFSKDMVTKPKPAPDAYLAAMRKMGVSNPQDCVVVEDSSTGVRAGVAAGMCVIGFIGATKSPARATFRLKSAGATEIVQTMGGVVRKIEARFGPLPSPPSSKPPTPDNH